MKFIFDRYGAALNAAQLEAIEVHVDKRHDETTVEACNMHRFWYTLAVFRGSDEATGKRAKAYITALADKLNGGIDMFILDEKGDALNAAHLETIEVRSDSEHDETTIEALTVQGHWYTLTRFDGSDEATGKRAKAYITALVGKLNGGN